ncbi:hypothetical protein Dvar_18480 [Desulfosarcina variabilis str. Montpellier]|uniref:phytochelatin synthase family protein n=1 Tax=Desulfosarcina variabilis TaxID=2300 RepID=UPI003AFA458F
MNLLRNLIRPYLAARYTFHRITGTGAFARNRTRYMDASRQSHWNALKQAIWKYHVKQFHESSCSVASVVSCINALRALRNGDITPISQHDILDRISTGHWKARMSKGGYHGRRGLPLPLLGQVVKDSIAAYGLAVRAVAVVPTPVKTFGDASIHTTLKARLKAFDQKGDGLIIAHFDQGAFIPTLNIPHISPVGAYDAASGQVTLLDVDPDEKRPYQVSYETFYTGLSSNYHHMFTAFGYNGGGYVYIQVY